MTTLRPLSRYNWEDSLRIETAPEDADYIPSVLHSLAESKFEPLTPLGIFHVDEMIGFCMYGEFSNGLYWINRILIDMRFRRRGYAAMALTQLVAILQRKPTFRELRSSYHPQNTAAAGLFASHGFVPINEALADETIVYLP
jgi:diamine N-acetyltransferase